MPATARATRNPYGHRHRQIRARLIRHALGTMCPGDWVNGRPYRSRNCHGIMTNPRHMHLAHTIPLALGGTDGDTICCSACNLGAGAILGNQLRGTARHHTPGPRRTRTW